MPEYFEEQLERAAELAAIRARLDRVGAIRARGDQLRRRRRTADAVLGVAVVAVAVVLGTTLTGGSSNSHLPVTGSPSASVSAPAASPSTGATGTPSAGRGRPSASTTATGSPGTSQNTGAATTPGTYVAGAWLSAHQESFGDQISWQPATNLAGSWIGDAVFEVTDADTATQLATGTGCALSGFETSLAGTQYQMFDGPNDGTKLGSTAIAAYATQGIYFYPDSAAATSAWNSLSSDYWSCAQTETGTNAATGLQEYGFVHQLVNQSDAQCWSNLQTRTDSATSSGMVSNGCYLLRGDLIEWVNVQVNDSTPSGVDFSSVDHTTLTNMRQSLTVYDN